MENGLIRGRDMGMRVWFIQALHKGAVKNGGQ